MVYFGTPPCANTHFMGGCETIEQQIHLGKALETKASQECLIFEKYYIKCGVVALCTQEIAKVKVST